MAANNRVVILDACRTPSLLLKQMVNESAKASMDALVGTQGTGSLIAYAASERKASSGRSSTGLSLYTQFLVQALKTHPKDMETALSRAKEMTIAASRRAQVPAIYDEMEGRFSLIPPGDSPSRETADDSNAPSTNPGDIRAIAPLQLSQQTIEEADKMTDLLSRPENLPSRPPASPLFARQRLTEEFKDCCQQDFKSLRAELLSSLGPSGNDPGEIQAWQMLFPEEKYPGMKGQQDVNGAAIANYAPYLRLLGLRLKHMVSPRKEPIALKFMEQDFPGSEKSLYRKVISIESNDTIQMGCIVVEFSSVVASAGTDFIGSRLASASDLIDNPELKTQLQQYRIPMYA
jgi:hypothetical protein